MHGELAFLIPIMAISVGLVAVSGRVLLKPWLAYREKQMEFDARMVAEKAAQYATQNGRLEERVRVLERIVTDRGVDLSNEIDQLRDLREPPLN
ncbi:MAG: hypothetical protein K2P68_09350 [Sphingomonas sp.]|nr:hypothetical protein [Sphingomonas sp.]